MTTRLRAGLLFTASTSLLLGAGVVLGQPRPGGLNGRPGAGPSGVRSGTHLGKHGAIPLRSLTGPGMLGIPPGGIGGGGGVIGGHVEHTPNGWDCAHCQRLGSAYRPAPGPNPCGQNHINGRSLGLGRGSISAPSPTALIPPLPTSAPVIAPAAVPLSYPTTLPPAETTTDLPALATTAAKPIEAKPAEGGATLAPPPLAWVAVGAGITGVAALAIAGLLILFLHFRQPDRRGGAGKRRLRRQPRVGREGHLTGRG